MNKKKYFISEEASLKWLESHCIYNIFSDELYEIDDSAFEFFKSCASGNGCNSCNISDVEFLKFSVEEGLLSKSRKAPRKIPSRQSPVPSLRYLELQITNRCNLSCRHCYIGKKSTVELDIDAIRKIMNEFEEIQGLRLLITGGEPLLYSRFDELNSMLHDYEFRKILFTNGLLLDSEILGKLNVNEIQISIDGLNEAHDFIRGKGTYEKSIEAVKMVAGTSFQVSVSTMVHTRNLNDFDEMGRIFSEIGVRDWSVDVPCIAGFLKDNPDIVPPPDVAGKYLRYGFGEGLHGGGAGYVCGLHLMSVMADGRAAKCSFYSEDPVGHIGEGLEICWKRVEHAPLSDLDCNCAHLDTCRGGCRYRASLSGNARSGDPYRCAAFLGSD